MISSSAGLIASCISLNFFNYPSREIEDLDLHGIRHEIALEDTVRKLIGKLTTLHEPIANRNIADI
jgi:hypothetical protein